MNPEQEIRELVSDYPLSENLREEWVAETIEAPSQLITTSLIEDYTALKKKHDDECGARYVEGEKDCAYLSLIDQRIAELKGAKE